MVVYPCDIHKVFRLLTGKKGQLKKEVPSIAMMTNFGFGKFTAKIDFLIGHFMIPLLMLTLEV